MLQKLFYTNIVKPIAQAYLRFNVKYAFDGFRLRIFSGVFHPGFFFSTTFLYSFLKGKELKNKAFLEIGCGSGLISMLAFRLGANVTAIDVDPLAVKNTKSNFEDNFGKTHKASIIESNLFQHLADMKFDVIAINPPYFFKNVEVNSQLAWYCGENGEYFQKLFAEIAGHLHPSASVWMVLAENCEIEKINLLAKTNGCSMQMVQQKKIKWEVNYIYQIKPEKVSY